MSSEDTAGDVAIRVRDVSKHFLLFDRPQDRLKQSIVPRLQRLVGRPPTRYYRDFAALSGVSFEIRRGETIGIVGRNGSGKSTLLQVICGTLRPNGGTVAVNGRIAALLELGAGFNPEFTGRENVYLNAAILGLSRAETDARFDDIARFADIGDFVDQPVKTYSSGMYVRLAFATAINVDPDILVVDEALAVGDEAFQRKCFARIEQIQDRGGTILFVTHAAQLVVQLCNRALLMDRGELIMDAAPRDVIRQYQRLLNLPAAEASLARREIKAGQFSQRIDSSAPPWPGGHRDVTDSDDGWFDPGLQAQSVVEFGAGGARIRTAELRTTAGQRVNVMATGRRFVLTYIVDFDRPFERVGFGMTIRTISGLELGGTGTSLLDRLIAIRPDARRVQVSLSFNCPLTPGTYFITIGTGRIDPDGEVIMHRLVDALAFRVIADKVRHSGIFDFDIKPEIKALTLPVHPVDDLVRSRQ